MFGTFLKIVAPFAITAAKIVATDPAMRNFVIDAFGGKIPRTHRAEPVRPHADAQKFGPCPSCRGTGLVAIYDRPAYAYYDSDRHPPTGPVRYADH